MALTRTFLSPVSFATLLTRPFTPNFDALYEADVGNPKSPWTEEMHTMLPPSVMWLISARRQ